MSESLRISDDAIYAAIASRRTSFDAMLWQVPMISFAAQAFLFTTAVAPESQPIARQFATFLAVIVSVLSVVLLGKHRQAEVTDSETLETLESTRDEAKSRPFIAHGSTWARRRQQTPTFPTSVQRLSTFWLWMGGMVLFATAMFVLLVLTFAAPEIFASPAVSAQSHAH